MNPQTKLLHVANNLGITNLKFMQGSTGTLYHSQNVVTGTGANQPNFTFFGGAIQGAQYIRNTNCNADGKLEVNEALLIEKIQFNRVRPQPNADSGTSGQFEVLDDLGAIVDLYIGNKRVLKQVRTSPTQVFLDGPSMQYYDTCEIFMEGVGIVIPPQVEFRLEANFFSNDFNTKMTGQTGYEICATLYGTRVLLNLNTSL